MNRQANYLTSCGCTCSVRICSPNSAAAPDPAVVTLANEGFFVVRTDVYNSEECDEVGLGKSVDQTVVGVEPKYAANRD